MRAQHVELEDFITDNKLRLSILEAEVREVRSEQNDAELRHEQSQAEACAYREAFNEASQQEPMNTADRVEAAWTRQLEELDHDASERSAHQHLELSVSAEAGIGIPFDKPVYTDDDLVPNIYKVLVESVRVYDHPRRDAACTREILLDQIICI